MLVTEYDMNSRRETIQVYAECIELRSNAFPHCLHDQQAHIKQHYLQVVLV